jgi:8-oxo-dGTP pyrophosphatase MutT (NUDIX family)
VRETLRGLLAARSRRAAATATAAAAQRRAAVLVPFVERGGEVRVVFTLRASGLRMHGGQWSFPGGRVDPGDPSPAATALRETEEEIGLAPSLVEVLGELSDVVTSTEYIVTPVVGWLDAMHAPFRANPREVAEIAEVPLARLRGPELVGGRTWSYVVDGRNIWGATARIVREIEGLLG